jgi:hypothetical protein
MNVVSFALRRPISLMRAVAVHRQPRASGIDAARRIWAPKSCYFGSPNLTGICEPSRNEGWLLSHRIAQIMATLPVLRRAGLNENRRSSWKTTLPLASST